MIYDLTKEKKLQALYCTNFCFFHAENFVWVFHTNEPVKLIYLVDISDIRLVYSISSFYEIFFKRHQIARFSMLNVAIRILI